MSLATVKVEQFCLQYQMTPSLRSGRCGVNELGLISLNRSTVICYSCFEEKKTGLEYWVQAWGNQCNTTEGNYKQEQTKVTALHLTVRKTMKVMPSLKLRDIAGKFCGLYITWSFGTNTGYYNMEHFTLIIGTKIIDSWTCIQSYLLSFLFIWLSPNNFSCQALILSLVIAPVYYINKYNWYIWKKNNF